MEIIFYGRGGQGVNTSYQTTSQLFPLMGLFSWASAFYGAERTKAPMWGYVRVQGEPMTNRSEVTDRDAVVVVANPFGLLSKTLVEKVCKYQSG